MRQAEMQQADNNRQAAGFATGGFFRFLDPVTQAVRYDPDHCQFREVRTRLNRLHDNQPFFHPWTTR
jgi:hypothetical protein